jgi:hypothetical protein
MKQKVALKYKKLRTQINGKFNDINSADKNKETQNITVGPLFKNYKKTTFIHR